MMHKMKSKEMYKKDKSLFDLASVNEVAVYIDTIFMLSIFLSIVLHLNFEYCLIVAVFANALLVYMNAWANRLIDFPIKEKHTKTKKLTKVYE